VSGPSGVAAFVGVDDPMTSAQAARLRWLAEETFELEAFHPHITSAEAERRIEALSAKLRLQDGPPHTL
jgi:DUF3072 family protein